MSDREVLIAGAGWAGLAAGVRLSQCGWRVRLVEATRSLGGRARPIRFGHKWVDNGQHLLMGAYHETLRLLGLLRAQPEERLLRLPLHLCMRGPHTKVSLRAPRLPAPLHLLWAVTTARGLGWRDRLAIAGRARGLLGSGYDGDVRGRLARCGQSRLLSETLWEPLCLAALNTEPECASARLFGRVLREGLFGPRADSDLLISRVNLVDLLAAPAVEFIRARGGEVVTGTRLQALEITGDRLRGVRLAGQWQQTSSLILASGWQHARTLLAAQPGLRAYSDGLARLEGRPICTVYLRYPHALGLRPPMQGLLGGLGQWLFDRGVCGEPGLAAVVISGHGPHTGMDRSTLVRHISRELARLHPDWSCPTESLVVTEKNATFAAVAGVDSWRPAQTSPVRGLLLAGDYTATQLPATLEGAVRSGIACADALLKRS